MFSFRPSHVALVITGKTLHRCIVVLSYCWERAIRVHDYISGRSKLSVCRRTCVAVEFCETMHRHVSDPSPGGN